MFSDDFQVPRHPKPFGYYRKKQQAKLHYTVTPIGGAKELEDWKAAQAQRQVELAAISAAKFEEAKTVGIGYIMSRPMSSLPLTEMEKAEIEWLKNRDRVVLLPPMPQPQAPKKSLSTKFKDWWSDLIAAAFP